MDEYLQANQKLWDQWTIEHEKSPFYDLAGFRVGKDRLRSIELSELGDVSEKSLLHLQCHFGMDALAWARRGAIVTGVDFSEKSIALARSLSQELSVPAKFLCSDIYQLPDTLSGEFDIVFTSYGVLHWLRDLHQWGKIIAHFLKPNGIFYIVEDHPTFRMFTTEEETKIKLANPYFFSETPEQVEMTGSYATDNKGETASFYIWDHGIGDYVIACLETERPSFYERLGWEVWRGPLAGWSEHGLIPTPDQTGVMILRLPQTPALNLDGGLTIECQGRIW